MPREATALLFLEEPNRQYALVIKFEQSVGGVRGQLMKVFDATTQEDVERNEWPDKARFQELLAVHGWAYDNDPDRKDIRRRTKTSRVKHDYLRERKQLNTHLPPWSMN